jgi:hypothetical protein
LHGYEAEIIFNDFAQECAKMFLAVRNTNPRHHFSTSKSRRPRPVVVKTPIRHRSLRLVQRGGALAVRVVSNMKLVCPPAEYSNNVKAYITTKIFCKVEHNSEDDAPALPSRNDVVMPHGVALNRFGIPLYDLRVKTNLSNPINAIPAVQMYSKK